MGAQRTVSLIFGMKIEPKDGVDYGDSFTEWLNERLWGEDGIGNDTFVGYELCGKYGDSHEVFLHYRPISHKLESGTWAQGETDATRLDIARLRLALALAKLGVAYAAPSWMCLYDES